MRTISINSTSKKVLPHNYTDLNSANYLKKYDLLTKYSIKNIYKLPEIKSLNIYFTFSSRSSISQNIEMQAKLYSALYFLFNKRPEVRYRSSSKSKSKQGDLDYSYLYQVNFYNKKEIQEVFLQLYLENKKEYSSFLLPSPKDLFLNKTFNFKINGGSIAFLEELCFSALKGINPKDLYLNYSIQIK